MRSITIIMVIIFITVIKIPPALALEDIGQSLLHPAHPLYFLKSVREYLELKFAGNFAQKTIRQLEFSTRRIREVKALVQVDQEMIAPTMERYWFHLQRAGKPREEFLIQQIRQTLETHLAVLENIYSKLSDPRAKLAVRSKISKIVVDPQVQIAEEIRLSGCHFLAKVATSSALNETEMMVFSNRAQKCIAL